MVSIYLSSLSAPVKSQICLILSCQSQGGAHTERHTSRSIPRTSRPFCGFDTLRLRPQPGPEFKRILFDTDTVHRHGSAASSIGRVMSLGHTVQMARTVAIHTGSSQISSGRSHSCLWSRLRSRPAVPATLVIGHVSRLSCTCCLWRILRISRRRMRLFHFTPLVSARQQAAAAATSSCQPS